MAFIVIRYDDGIEFFVPEGTQPTCDKLKELYK